MSVQFSIHPQDGRKPGTLMFSSARPFDPKNANACSLQFKSLPRNAAYDFQTVDNEITAFYLNAVDAELLSTIGLLDAERRAAILPAVRHALDVQTAEAEIALEDIAEEITNA